MIHQGEVSAAAILALIRQGARRARCGGPTKKTVVEFKDPRTRVRGAAHFVAKDSRPSSSMFIKSMLLLSPLTPRR